MLLKYTRMNRTAQNLPKVYCALTAQKVQVLKLYDTV